MAAGQPFQDHVPSELFHGLHIDAANVEIDTALDESLAEEDHDQHSDLPPHSPVVDASIPEQFSLLKQRPDPHRSTTDPSTSSGVYNNYFIPRPSSSHRNRSPFSRSHLRSRSGSAALTPPMMTRAYSSPAVHTGLSKTFDLPSPLYSSLSPNSSPRRSPARQRSPLRLSEESVVPRSPSWSDSQGHTIQAIQEDSELDLTPRAVHLLPTPTAFTRSSSLRRRPASPFTASPTTAVSPVIVGSEYVQASAPSVGANSSSAQLSHSPSVGAARFNESYPVLHHFASSSSFSSIPSTPTSTRSRSPSISSLDTIEDAPDLEIIEAIEAERMMEQRLRLGEEDDVGPGPQRRGSFEAGSARVGLGFARGGSARERKRWSVCGAERRVDLDLDTIWED